MTSASGSATYAVGVDGDAEPLAARAGDVADRRELEAAVHLLGLAEERGRVANRSADDAVGDDPDRHVAHLLVLRQSVAGRLESDQTVDRGRNPDRATSVVRVRHRHRARRDQGRGAGRARAGDVVGVPRRTHRTQSGMLGSSTEAVLRELALAQRDQAGGEIHASEVAVPPGRVTDPGVGALAGRQAGHVDVVLDQGRYAGEVAALGVTRLRARSVIGREGHAVELRIDLFDAGDRCVDHVAHRHLTGVQGLDQSHRIVVTEGVVTEGMHSRHGDKLPAGPPIEGEYPPAERRLSCLGGGSRPDGGRRCRSPPSGHTSWWARRTRSPSSSGPSRAPRTRRR